MSKLFFILLLAITFNNYAQNGNYPINIYYENTGEGAIVYVDNDGYCPYTVDLVMDLTNMVSDRGSQLTEVIPVNAKKYRIAEITIKDKTKGSGFNFRSVIFLGDAIHEPSLEHIYRLPFKDGESYVMSQGYNGDFSHQGKNSLDFTMPEGTRICAARDGIVITVKDDSNRGCPNKRCMDDANNIVIYHEDGTFSEYAHLKKRGSKVQTGQIVKEGEVIGLSGNTGFTSGPHLHFEVYYFNKTEKITVPTKFKIDGNQIDFLQEKVFYKAI